MDSLIEELVTASRILADENIVDSFGHISVRHPERADRFFISRVRAPELVTSADIVELDLQCEPVRPTEDRLFIERVIHAAVYRLRSDVHAVCHHHAPAMLPFCASGVPLVPVVHLGATMGIEVPMWDSREAFGDTNLLVATEDQGLSMARALGPNWTVLLRRHGATVAGRTIRECVFRAVYGARNAEIQSQAMRMGALDPLTPGEAIGAEDVNLAPIALDRAWQRWCARIGRSV